MKKTRLFAVVMTIAVAASCVLPFGVFAAEKSSAPWKVYRVPNSTYVLDNATELFAREADGKTYYAPTTKTTWKGYNTVVALNVDSEGTMNVNAGWTDPNDETKKANDGDIRFAFTVPYTGNWKFDVSAKNIASWVDNTSGWFKLMETSTEELNTFETINLPGYASGETITKSVTKTLQAGTVIYAQLGGSYNGARYTMTYTVTDANDENVCFNLASASGLDIVLSEDEYKLTDYAVEPVNDTSMWSVYSAPVLKYAIDTDSDNTKDTLIDNSTETYKLENLTALPKSSRGQNTLRYVNTDTYLEFYNAFNQEEFVYYMSATSAMVLGWTAPETGDYLIDFSGYNAGARDVAVGSRPHNLKSRHILASAKTGDTAVTPLDDFEIAGYSTDVNVTEKQYIYHIEQGETLYLINDRNVYNNVGWSARGSVFMNYTITNMADFSKQYKASELGKKYQKAPFEVFRVNDSSAITTLTEAWNADWKEKDGKIVAYQDSQNYISLADGVEFFSPHDSNAYLSFRVPADGIWLVQAAATNEDATATALYRMTGINNCDYTEPSFANKVAEGTEIYAAVNALKGDQLVLGKADGGTNTYDDIIFTRLDEYSFKYTVNGSEIDATAELLQGDAVKASFVYVAEAAQTLNMVTAIYDKTTKAMLYADVADSITLAAGEAGTMSAEVTLPQAGSNVIVKTFVFDTFETLMPLYTPFVIQ